MTAPDIGALRALLARVESAEGPDREIDAAVWAITLPRDGIGLDGFGLPDGAHYEYEVRQDRVHMHVILDNKRLGHGTGRASREPPALTASIDAIVPLVGRVLPGWWWDLCTYESGQYEAFINPPDYRGPDTHPCGMGIDASPARALVRATLRALIAQAEATPQVSA